MAFTGGSIVIRYFSETWNTIIYGHTTMYQKSTRYDKCVFLEDHPDGRKIGNAAFRGFSEHVFCVREINISAALIPLSVQLSYIPPSLLQE